MELSDEILTKQYINDRFIEAAHLVLNQKLVTDKATLAEALKCKPSKFSEILNYRMKAGIDMVARICEIFEISPDWVLLSRGGYFRTSQAPSIFISQGPGTLEYSLQMQAHEDYKKKEIVENQQETSTLQVDTLLMLIKDKEQTIKDKDRTIREQAEEIGRLKLLNAQLEREKGSDASVAESSKSARVG